MSTPKKYIVITGNEPFTRSQIAAIKDRLKYQYPSDWRLANPVERISNVNEITSKATRKVDEVRDDPKISYLKMGLGLVGFALLAWVFVLLAWI